MIYIVNGFYFNTYLGSKLYTGSEKKFKTESEINNAIYKIYGTANL